MECAIFAKHRGGGELEARRHAPTLSDLTDAAAGAVGAAVTRAAQVRRSELAPEAVYSMITGRSVSHFNQHVFARPVGTPDAVPWYDTQGWIDASELDEAGLIELGSRLRAVFAD